MARAKKQKDGVPSGTPVSPPEDDTITLDIVEHLQGLDDAHVSTMGKNKSVIINPKFLSTGLPSIDHMLGGGLAAGRITELWSKGEGLGKSSLAAHCMAEMQRQGGEVMLMDTEHGFTGDRLRTLGVDPDEVAYVQPDHIEAACKVISGTIKYMAGQKTAPKLLIVWDSLTGTQSKQGFDADYDQILMAAAARSWSAVLLKLKDELAKSEIYVVMINQTRENIGGGAFAEKHKSTGGMAMKYYAAVRLVLSRGANAWIKEGSQRIGFKVNMHTEKSRLAAPYRTGQAVLMFEDGFDRHKSLFDLLLTLKLIKPAGARYEMRGLDKSFYAKDFEKALAALPKDVEQKIINVLKEDGKLTLPVVRYFFPNAS